MLSTKAALREHSRLPSPERKKAHDLKGKRGSTSPPRGDPARAADLKAAKTLQLVHALLVPNAFIGKKKEAKPQ